MNERAKCTDKNETLKMICEIEKNYRKNFKAQAKLFKSFFNNLEDANRIDKIKIFISKETPETRWEVIKDTPNIIENTDVLYLGIPGSLGRSYWKVEDQVKKLIEILVNKEEENKFLATLKDNASVVKVNATTTSIMYLFFPEKFIPIAGPVPDLLVKLGIRDDIDTWDKYDEALKKLKQLVYEEENGDFGPSFTIAFSFTSWLMENQVDNILNKFINYDKNKAKNIILTGIPGTGKTFTIQKFLDDNQDKYEYEFVQFHPSYDYEDFIEGLKPYPVKGGLIEFRLVNGIFKKLCKRAFENDKKTFVMVIDEINRANLSRVFGELLYCLEYRGEFVGTKMTTYIEPLDNWKDFSVSDDEENKGKFAIPENVIILGTMNEVDRSIDAFDLALRRRFIWEDVAFNETALRLYVPFFTNANDFQKNIEDLIVKAKKLNKVLKNRIGSNYEIGHTYYFKIADYFDGNYDSALCDLWNYHIKSLVREYCKIKFGEDELEKKLEEYKKIVVGDKNCNG